MILVHSYKRKVLFRHNYSLATFINMGHMCVCVCDLVQDKNSISSLKLKYIIYFLSLY